LQPSIAAEFACRSPAFFTGYWTAEGGIDREDFDAEGYFRPGEIFEIAGAGDEAYDCHYIDRLKDVIKSGGEWISSLSLEDIISQLPGVGEVAAIGIPDEKWGERPLVLVVLKQDQATNVDENTIRQHVQAHADRGEISPWAVPEQVLIVPAIEKTSVGKIDKKRLRAHHALST